ncbi:ATP-binding protein [Aporhodopirellula aestuarii]|uniref:ATP-binding protein n=1 Tax=Aporhodopirellula aestuarii TaxID=2950107 RepID=A0ABT0UEB1_9BACT|nr:ATP-binding protein [Aporhodopirellula aestuarii]MCM2375081.1 ATP-binding protein [Aporhodopirellula aestuarii]
MSFEQIDYRHYLEQNKLRESDRFQPVFEAVENAFNAIEERVRLDEKAPAGVVKVTIHRDESQQVLNSGNNKSQMTPAAVSGITIADNGIGFREANWQAFKTIYTSHKKLQGGKGVGRLSYLQAFRSATVNSIFTESGICQRRKFTITRTSEGVSKCVCNVIDASETKTIVSLQHFEGFYCRKAPKLPDAIARQFAVHFFQRLSVDDGITCLLIDEWDSSTLNLHEFCKTEFMLRKEDQTLTVNGHDLTVTHSKCKTRVAEKHQIMLCANGRVVKPFDVPAGVLPTRKKLNSPQGGYFYIGFVCAPLLDENATQDRLGFALEETLDSTELLPDDAPSLQHIVDAVSNAGRDFLASDIDPLEAEHRKRVYEYCDEKLLYRPLLSNRMEQMMAMPFGLSDREFAKEIWSIYSEWKGDIRKRFNAMAKTVRENTDKLRDFTDQYREILRDMSQMAFYELADYVTDRRAVIDFLDSSMAFDADGKFRDEDAIHDIFFPRKQTSNDIAWDESNLWLIDERLAFQQFAASDIPLAQMGLDGSVSRDRPDVAIAYEKFFDATFAFADQQTPFTSLTLVEFKKPERTNYDEKENPISQALRYIREIREKKSFTHAGRKFRLADKSPIHIYVICHIVDNLTKHMSGYNYIETPDGEGIWLYMPRENALVQIMTFEKVIADAKKRNDVFFHKLGIDRDIELKRTDPKEDAA